MPELPEVEAVCRRMERALGGKRIVRATVAPDSIVLSGVDPEAIRAHLEGNSVRAVGRRGKFWWLQLEDEPWLFGHLGMAGWVRELGVTRTRLREHGSRDWDDEEGNPRFLKLLLESDEGDRIAFTDGRRLGRLWLANSAADDSRVSRLGPDALRELPSARKLGEMLQRRSGPIKAVLLDQGFLAGIGNWVADEVLYHSRISPKRGASTLEPPEVRKLRSTILKVLEQAVGVEADYEQFPRTWLFHHRWGGSRGPDSIGGRDIVREQVGGRTTAWVPEWQR